MSTKAKSLTAGRSLPPVITRRSNLNSEFCLAVGKFCLLATAYYTSDKCFTKKQQIILAIQQAIQSLASALQMICDPGYVVSVTLADPNSAPDSKFSKILGDVWLLTNSYFASKQCADKKERIIQAVESATSSLATVLQGICKPGTDCPGELVWCQLLEKCVASVDDCKLEGG
jgi:hypothetical protein